MTSPRLIVLLGPDGAGKSTIAALLQDRIVSRGVGVDRWHWRPRTLPGGREGFTPTDFAHIRDSEPRGPIRSIALLVYYWCDFLVGSAAASLSRRRTIIIAERYFYDVLIDPARYRLRTVRSLALMLSRLIPKPRVCVLLTGVAQTIAARKGELNADEVQRQIEVLVGVAEVVGPERSMFLDVTSMSADEVARLILGRAVSCGLLRGG